METLSKKACIRNAEKDRKFSTCKFADRIFHCVTKQLDHIIQKDYWPKKASPYRKNIEHEIEPKDEKQQTVLAAFLIHNAKTDILQCVSLALGTKFLVGHLTDSQIGMYQG